MCTKEKALESSEPARYPQSMEHAIRYDVLVVGAGLGGLATVYHLSKSSGLCVALLEKESSIAAHASGRNAGMLRQACDQSVNFALIQETSDVLKNPPDDWIEKNIFHCTGSVLVGKKNVIETYRDILRAASVETECFSRGHYPAMNSPQIQSWLKSADYEALLWTPSDGVVDVQALNQNFFCAALKRGVNVFFERSVSEMIESDSGWEVHCGNEIFKARVVVNAAGAWASSLGASAGAKSEKMQAFRRHLIEANTENFSDANLPLFWDIEHEFYLRPEKGAWLLSPGDETQFPPGHPPTDPQAADWLREKMTRHLPGFDAFQVKSARACLRVKSSSGKINLGWDARRPAFYWVAALGGQGLSCSYGAGRRAASDILTHLSANPQKVYVT